MIVEKTIILEQSDLNSLHDVIYEFLEENKL